MEKLEIFFKVSNLNIGGRIYDQMYAKFGRRNETPLKNVSERNDSTQTSQLIDEYI